MTLDLFAPAVELAAAVRRKEISSLELTRAYIDRIEQVNPKLNAYVLTTPELALSQAREADDGHGGALRGVPVSIKDLISVAGYPMTLGSRAFEHLEMPVDFFPVARLKEEGCPILGKTNTSEFGSRPATDGVIARSVADAAAGLDAMAGHLPGDPYWAESEGRFADATRPNGRKLRVGFTTTADASVESEVAELVRSVARTVESLGHGVSEGGPDTGPFRGPFQLIVVSGIASLPIHDESLLDPFNQLSVAFAKNLSATDYVRAVDAIRVHARQVVSFWDDHDVLITPTLPQTAPKLGTLGANLDTAGDEYMEFVAFTYPYNCTGQPAMSLPLGMDSAGLPIGVQLVGPPRGESVILGLAAQLEHALPWSARRPTSI